jgi:hypothetical protein
MAQPVHARVPRSRIEYLRAGRRRAIIQHNHRAKACRHQLLQQGEQLHLRPPRRNQHCDAAQVVYCIHAIALRTRSCRIAIPACREFR